MKLNDKMKWALFFGRFLKRSIIWFFKGFFRYSIVFTIVFTLMILHLSKTMPIPALDWILRGGFIGDPYHLEPPEPILKKPQSGSNLLP